jgi:hypothetical protein
MKKSIFLLFLILTLSACTQSMVDDVIDSIPFVGGDEEIQRAVDLGDPGECEKLKDEDANRELRRKNQCFQRVAEKINDPVVCKMIVGDESRWNNCFVAVAAGAKQPELCEEIQNNNTVKGNCYKDAAIALDDESWCAKSNSSSQNNCYAEIAQNKQDAGICDNIENASISANCVGMVAVAAQNIDICDKIKDDARNWLRCINSTAAAANNLDWCEKQTEREERDTCYSIVAKDNNNIDACDRIEYDEDHEACIRGIARRTRDESLCSGLRERGQSDYCYDEVAQAKNDVTICDKVENEYSRSFCYANIAAKNGNMDLCLSMNVNDSSRADCLLKASKKGNDSTSCKQLEGEQLYACAFNVASYQRNARFCGLAISSQGTREKCIHEVVSKYKDEKVCAPITDPGDKEKCLNSLKFVE